MTDTVRLNVNMSQKTADALRELADDQQVSVTEAVRRAVAISSYLLGEQAKDRVVMTATKDGREQRQIMLM